MTRSSEHAFCFRRFGPSRRDRSRKSRVPVSPPCFMFRRVYSFGLLRHVWFSGMFNYFLRSTCFMFCGILHLTTAMNVSFFVTTAVSDVLCGQPSRWHWSADAKRKARNDAMMPHSHTPLSHTPSFTHNFVTHTHHLSLSHTNFHMQLCHHNLHQLLCLSFLPRPRYNI